MNSETENRGVLARFIATLERDDFVGTFWRSIALSLMLAGCFGLSFAARSLFSIDISTMFLVVALLVILVPMVIGLVLSEYPRGDDYVMMRIGFATFCRTGLPLLVVVLVARYSDPTFASKSMVFLLVFYAVGFLTSVGLSLYRLSGSSSSPKSHEVDSAAA